MEYATDESDTDLEELPIFLPVSQPEQIVTLDNSLAEGDCQEITLLNARVGEEQEANQASPPRNIVEDLLPQSGLSPLAPAFSPPIPASSASSASSNALTENQ